MVARGFPSATTFRVSESHKDNIGKLALLSAPSGEHETQLPLLPSYRSGKRLLPLLICIASIILLQQCPKQCCSCSGLGHTTLQRSVVQSGATTTSMPIQHKRLQMLILLPKIGGYWNTVRIGLPEPDCSQAAARAAPTSCSQAGSFSGARLESSRA